MAAMREITPLVARLRDFTSGRKIVNYLRFEQNQVARSQPPPVLPGGPSHKLSANYYFTRDGRREVTPPEVVYGGPKALEAGQAGEAPAKLTSVPRPGAGHGWH